MLFPPEGCAFSIGSRVGAVESRYKNINVLKGVCAFSDGSRVGAVRFLWKECASSIGWSCAELRLQRSEAWYFLNVVYIDPCNTILSGSFKIGFDENQAAYGKGERWMSPDVQLTVRNLCASPYATKQARYYEVLRWLKIMRSACMWSMRTCSPLARPCGLVRIVPQLSREMGMSVLCAKSASRHCYN